jgi:hypothetical protein
MDRGHDQNIGDIRQAREGIEFARIRAERDIRVHLALVFEIDVFAPIQDRHRFAHLVRPVRARIAERGMGKERDARRGAKAARRGGCLDRDLRQLRRDGKLRDRCIGDKKRAAFGEHDRHAHHALAAHRIDHAPYIFQHGRIIARHARHHAVGMAKRDHAGAEHIAVEVHKPLRVALQEAEALLTLIEIIRIGRVLVGHARIHDLQVCVFRHANQRHVAHDLLFAADQNGLPKLELLIRKRRADHCWLLAFGEHDALGAAPHRILHALQERRGWVEPLGKAFAICLHVRDGFARDARIHRGLRDEGRHG